MDSADANGSPLACARWPGSRTSRSSGASRGRGLRGLAALLRGARRAASAHPRLRGLHWADDGLLDFVDELADWVTDVPMFVVCTARPELLARRPNWGGGKLNASTIALAPLSDDETARLIGSPARKLGAAGRRPADAARDAPAATPSTPSSSPSCTSSGAPPRTCRSPRRCRASSRSPRRPAPRREGIPPPGAPSSGRSSGRARSAARASTRRRSCTALSAQGLPATRNGARR